MIIERDADDVARCFALERTLFETGPQQEFAGEIIGLISAGAFIAFGFRRDEQTQGAQRPSQRTRSRRAAVPGGEVGESSPEFEGMLPVRVLRASSGSGAATKGSRSAQARGGGRRGPASEERRDWWELNEQGTILRGERSGATLRLGDPVEVRVARVDTIRGRVDLLPFQDPPAG